MSVLSALSTAPNQAFDTGASSLELGGDRLARAPAVEASHQVDGVAMQGQSSLIENVGVGAQKGRLMAGRSVTGKLVFWLDGAGKQSVLRGANGKPVTNLPEARVAAPKALATSRSRPAPTVASPAPEASGQGQMQGVKMVTGYDTVNRQMRRGELVTVRGATGQPTFWLRGGGTKYPLRTTGGEPITDSKLAEARAHQLIGSGAATKLREVHLASVGGTEVRPPADRTSPRLAIDLESPSLNAKGGQGQAHFGLLGTRLGNKGSALTSNDAVQRARAMGIDVKVINENPKGTAEFAKLHAWVQLTNDRTGGRQFANFTINLSPGEPDLNATSYKLPANASAAFIEGYNQASREIGFAQVGQVARTVAEGRATTSTARGNVSVPVRPTRIVPTGQPIRATLPPSARAPIVGRATRTPAVKPSTDTPSSSPDTVLQTGKSSAANPTTATVPTSAKQRLIRQLSAIGIQCDDPKTIRTGPKSHAVVGTTTSGVGFQVSIRGDGSLDPDSAAVSGKRSVQTDPPNEAGQGGGTPPDNAGKKRLLLTGPKMPFQSVVSMPPPSPESIPRIRQPTKVIGAGEVNVIYEHPTNPNLVVSMTNDKLITQIAKFSENNDTGPWELRSTSGDVNTLKWMGQAGLPVIKPIGLVRIGNRYGVVKPKITGGIFSKDPAPASTAAWRQLVKSHGREIIQQLRHIDRSLKSLGVNDTDFQFYIDAKGQVGFYDPGLVTPEPDPSRYQHRISELWIDRIKTDMQRIRYGEPVIGPVTGDEQKNLIRS